MFRKSGQNKKLLQQDQRFQPLFFVSQRGTLIQRKSRASLPGFLDCPVKPDNNIMVGGPAAPPAGSLVNSPASDLFCVIAVGGPTCLSSRVSCLSSGVRPVLCHCEDAAGGRSNLVVGVSSSFKTGYLNEGNFRDSPFQTPTSLGQSRIACMPLSSPGLTGGSTRKQVHPVGRAN